MCFNTRRACTRDYTVFRNVITNKKNFFLKKLRIMICLLHRNGKTLLILLLKNHLLYPNLTTRCQNVEKIVRQTNSKLLLNLTGWKTEYLIAQLRTGFRGKNFRLKTCPQGVLQAQQEKSGFLIFTTSTSACISGTWPLNSMLGSSHSASSAYQGYKKW